jgi:SAM-dependent methyltransferase
MTHPEHVVVNQAMWDADAPEWVTSGERAWGEVEPSWGIWGVPETEVELLPTDMSGMDAIELGCGTGYVSSWMARRGAKCVGIDISANQLATARRLADEHELQIELIHGSAETVPYPDGSFDFAISEYGAALWCDPYVWVPEAHRLLRPGGILVFVTNSSLSAVCSPVDGAIPITERLEREYFGMHRVDWRAAKDDPGGIEFNLTTGDWVALFLETGFEVLDYREPRPAIGGPEVNFFVSGDWARRWPSEQVWKLRKP